jgi:hypothetical protein
MPPRWSLVATATALPVRDQSTILTILPHSSSIPTAIGLKRPAIFPSVRRPDKE